MPSFRLVNLNSAHALSVQPCEQRPCLPAPSRKAGSLVSAGGGGRGSWRVSSLLPVLWAGFLAVCAVAQLHFSRVSRDTVTLLYPGHHHLALTESKTSFRSFQGARLGPTPQLLKSELREADLECLPTQLLSNCGLPGSLLGPILRSDRSPALNLSGPADLQSDANICTGRKGGERKLACV